MASAKWINIKKVHSDGLGPKTPYNLQDLESIISSSK